MGQKVLFGGKIYTEPVSVARIISGISNAGSPASFGNIVIIDTGLGASYGGGKGVLDNGGAVRSVDEFVYQITNAADMKRFVKGGVLWDLADYIFNPSNQGVGASLVYYMRAAQTNKASETLTFTGAFNLVIDTKRDEGLICNGTLSGSDLSKGYAITLEAGVLDTSKFILKFWEGAYKGVDGDGYYFDGIDEATAAKSPRLVAQSAEITTVEEFNAWAAQDENFGQLFAIGTGSATTGTIVTADLTLLAGYNLFAGGTETYNATAMDELLNSIKEIDNSIFIALENDTNAAGTNNLKILAHINNEAEHKKFMVVGGGNNSASFEGAGTSLANAALLNSRYAILCHSGLEVPYINNSQVMTQKSSIYLAALVAGRMSGLEPQKPLTYKNLRINKLKHVLTQPQRVKAIDGGVLHIRQVPELGYVVNQGINTLQQNNFMVNADGSSPEISIERIEAQLNKELAIAGRRFIGGNIFSVNKGSLVEFTRKYLESKQVKQGVQDGLIIDFGNIKAQRQGTSWFVSYDFQANTPINKIFNTGTIIDPTV